MQRLARHTRTSWPAEDHCNTSVLELFTPVAVVTTFDATTFEVFDTDACASNRHTKECTMNEHDASPMTSPSGHASSTSDESAARSGDPSHDLFGNGWAPKGRLVNTTEYTGRHRAPEA